MFSHSQVAQTPLSVKPQCPHWSQSLNIPWQNFTSGFAAQQKYPQGCGSLGNDNPISPFPAPLWPHFSLGSQQQRWQNCFFLPRCCMLFCPHYTLSFQTCCHIKDRIIFLIFPCWSVHPCLHFPTDVACRKSKDSEKCFSIQLLQDHPMLSQTSLLLSLHVLISPPGSFSLLEVNGGCSSRKIRHR